jgi:hypothetical protein
VWWCPIPCPSPDRDSSICVVVEEASAQAALVALEIAFDRELDRGLIAGINAEYGHSVVAIVGEGMAFRPGTGATFTKAMANAGINIRSIAQGSSERQVQTSPATTPSPPPFLPLPSAPADALTPSDRCLSHDALSLVAPPRSRSASSPKIAQRLCAPRTPRSPSPTHSSLWPSSARAVPSATSSSSK